MSLALLPNAEGFSRREGPNVRGTRRTIGTLVVYAFLTFLVWGAFALDRGLWQDDVSALGLVQNADPTDPRELFRHIASPTRRLIRPPYILAQMSGDPVVFLQLLYGLEWLGIGILAHLLAREFFGQEPLWAFLTGALTLTATSDLLTNCLVLTSYNQSVLFYFAALLAYARWLIGGGRLWLVAAILSLNVSVFTTDGAFAAALLTPLLIWALRGFARDPRFLRGAAVWFAALAPYLAIFFRTAFNPSSYARVAIVPLTPTASLGRLARLVLQNFTPWAWAFQRPLWFDWPKRVIPMTWCVTAASLGTLLFLGWALRSRSGHELKPAGLRHALVVSLALLTMVVASNSQFVPVQLSEVFFRTHVVSRVFASLLLAFLAGELASRLGRWALVFPSAFVCLGILGGLERQDFFLSSWRRHRAEVASILDEAPTLAKETNVILYIPPGIRRYLATETSYLARSWTTVLYRKGPPELQTYLWSFKRESGCQAVEGGVVCWDEGMRECVAAGTCVGAVVPFGKLVFMSFDPEAGRFRLEESLPPGLIPANARGIEDYRPRLLIGGRPPGARPVVDGKTFLARFLP